MAPIGISGEPMQFHAAERGPAARLTSELQRGGQINRRGLLVAVNVGHGLARRGRKIALERTQRGAHRVKRSLFVEQVIDAKVEPQLTALLPRLGMAYLSCTGTSIHWFSGNG